MGRQARTIDIAPAVRAELARLGVPASHYSLGQGRLEIMLGDRVRHFPTDVPVLERDGAARALAAIATAVGEARRL